MHRQGSAPFNILPGDFRVPDNAPMNDDNVLIEHLTELGHSWAEIERILAKLAEHDKRSIHESVFDSIERGTFNLREIIAEATESTEATEAS